MFCYHPGSEPAPAYEASRPFAAPRALRSEGSKRREGLAESEPGGWGFKRRE